MAVRRMNLVVGARLASGETYCPTLADFDIAYGDAVTAEGNGWRVHGSGGVHGKTSWNLLGGSIEFDMDVCSAQPGINSNFYMISPEGGMASGYCDIQANDSPICLELDMVENNGQCLGQTTWHVWGDKSGGCDQNGCSSQFHLDDGCKFHMRTEFGEDGSVTQYRNGQVIQVSIEDREKDEIKQTMGRAGSAIASTQWFGWVPDDGSCSSGEDLNASEFAITNVVVNAPKGITFGPAPPVCASPAPTPPPPPAPAGETYCPTLADMDIAYGEGVTEEANGWRVHGSGGVHGKTSWNLLGGSIEFDMDVCSAQPGINTNFYMISPEGGPSSGYCDIQSNDSPICMELDMVENNGQCLGQTTWHVWGDHSGGCDQYGCSSQFRLGDGCKFHMRTEFGEDGSVTQYRNGQVIQVSIEDREKNEIKQTMERAGSAIASTQWEGWVPDDGSCSSGGDLSASEFAITNVVVHAPKGIKFGPAPPACSSIIAV